MKHGCALSGVLCNCMHMGGSTPIMCIRGEGFIPGVPPKVKTKPPAGTFASRKVE